MFGFLKRMVDGYFSGAAYEKWCDVARLAACHRISKLCEGKPKAEILGLAVWDYLLSEGSGGDINHFRAENAPLVEREALSLLDSDAELREVIVHTLWVKYAILRAHNKRELSEGLFEHPAMKLYGVKYPFPKLDKYAQVVESFQNKYGPQPEVG